VILREAPTRIGIYFFYDHDGVVDEYVVTFLEAMNKSLTRLVVVVNGKLTSEGRRIFEDLGASPLIVRENTGFDVWAYKAGIDRIGWDELAKYDELIMLNFTIMGPVGDFETMFADMSHRDVDFWGITVHNGASFDPWGKMPNGVIPLHIQSHFIAVRASMHTGTKFRSYWDDLGPIDSYEDSIAKHEALFTDRFADAGFSWDYYVDTADLTGETYYPLFNMPVDLIANRQSPIFKRKSFFATPDLYLDENSNRPARDLLDYLRASPDYDVDTVWRHIIRSANHYDVAMALNLFEVLDSAETSSRPSDLATGAIVGITSPADLSRRLPYLDALPDRARLVLVYPANAPGLEDVAALVRDSRWSTATLVPAEITSTPWSALTYYDGQLDDVDLVCVVEPSKRGEFPFTNAAAADRNSIDAVLATRGYVNRVIDFFARESRLGLIVPPRSLHHENYGELGYEWGSSFESVSGVIDELAPGTPVDQWKGPVSAADGKYWIRGVILASDRYRRARGSDLEPSELNLIAPFVAQAEGFYSSYVAPDVLAANFMTNSTHVIRRSNHRFGTGVGDTFSAFESRLQVLSRFSAFESRLQSSSIDETEPPPAVAEARIYLDYGSGFGESDTVDGEGYAIPGSTGVRFRFTVPAGTRALRFDPVERLGCVCVGLTATTERRSRVRLTPINGYRYGRFDIFETDDPQYVAYSWPRGATELEVTMENMVILRPPFARKYRRNALAALRHRVRRLLGRTGR
jgi:lipopolysaccharide biosynthesis protein